jgi:hydroxyethylthiazole kinase-like uncharacterized protein yjeF
MRLATVDQAVEIDELSQKVYGLTGEVLMESAGAIAAREIDQAYYPEISRGTVVVVCGSGNNGGDGLVLARHLHSAGHRDLIVFYLEGSKRSALFDLQLNRARLHGLKVISLGEHPEKWGQIRSASLLIDAIFGIGLTRPVEGDFLKLIDLVNSVKVPVISLDTPSGLNCDTGVVEGATIKASMTLSFGLAKPGFFVSDGPAYAGKVRVLPIGFPFESLRGVATSHFLFNEKLARRYLPSRTATAHKAQHGHLLVLAGSDNMWGAGVLASLAAYRMGCGYVTWASRQPPLEMLESAPEVLITSTKKALESLERYSAVVIGPGFGVGAETKELLETLKNKKIKNVIVDADAITTCVESKLFPLPESWVLTPHAGELSRVLKVSAAELNRDRFLSARQGAEVAGCHVVFKGFRTVLAFKERTMVVNSGNSSLAKAGTGDVLAGMIGGLLAQGLDTLQGTATAVYVHGRLADEWVRSGHDRSALTASDLAHHLPQLLSRLAGGSFS